MKKSFLKKSSIIKFLALLCLIIFLVLNLCHKKSIEEKSAKFKKNNDLIILTLNRLTIAENYHNDKCFAIKENQNDELCEKLAQMLNIESKKCNKIDRLVVSSSKIQNSIIKKSNLKARTNSSLYILENYVDKACLELNKSYKTEEITLSDNSIIYEAWLFSPFSLQNEDKNEIEFNKNFNSKIINYRTLNTCKVLCLDIDGANYGEEPFGYGLRIDGKIILGKRAKEWLENKK